MSKVTELISVRVEIETLICLLPKPRLLTVTLLSIQSFDDVNTMNATEYVFIVLCMCMDRQTMHILDLYRPCSGSRIWERMGLNGTLELDWKRF